MSEPIVLGVESSCDETGVALVRGTTLLGDALASSVDEHVRFGGVVPEVASRAHLEAIVPMVRRACESAGLGLADVDAVAVTSGPGLAGALMVGVAAAKAIAWALDRPLYGVNHLCAHVCADVLDHGPLPSPTVALLVSGGHTDLLLVRDIASDVQQLGGTIDDAAGEAFDKVARVLDVPYPGGPHLDRLARQGNPQAIRFPRGLTSGRDLQQHRYDFSFSGLKTAVVRWVQEAQRDGRPIDTADVAASFSAAVADVLTRKAIDACQAYGIRDLQIGGGVTANTQLRNLAEARCAEAGISLRVPRVRLCTDNGAMVAALGAQVVARGLPASGLTLGTDSSLPVSTVLV